MATNSIFIVPIVADERKNCLVRTNVRNSLCLMIFQMSANEHSLTFFTTTSMLNNVAKYYKTIFV